MKKNTIIIAAAASVMLAGCAKEQFVAPSSSKTVISVSIDDDTKTTIGDLSEGKRPIYWANDDQICINGLISEPLSGIEAESKKADFTFTEEPSTPYNTLYPAAYYKDATTVTMPTVASSLPVPMAAQGLALKPVTGVLKITVNKGEADANIVQVQISSTTAQLSGDFTINYADGTLAGIDSSEEAKTVTLKKNRALTAETPYEVFIPVPAGSYSFSVKILDDGGKYMVKSTSAAKTVKAGQILALEAFAFNPTGTQGTDVEITSAEELVAFAKKSNAGDYEGKPWIIAKLMNDITFDAATSKALVEEGGIGVQADSSKSRYVDHYFNGTFDGQGHSIKGYVSYLSVAPESGTDSLIARPIFNYTGSDSFIRNIVIDSSCDLQCPKGGFGSLAYRVKGVVENVTCNADININFIAGTANIGGIAGRIYGGSLKNCTMNGKIICNMDADAAATSKAWKLGGIAGTVEDGGSLNNCTQNGRVQWGKASKGLGPSVSTGGFWFGGIAGHLMKGSITGCSANDGIDAGKTNDIRGRTGKMGFLGGIVGQVGEDCTVTSCNNARICYIRAYGFTDPGTYNYIGGIAGYNQGTVTGCTNSAKITGNVAHETLALGGIVGKNEGNISSCSNAETVVGPSQYTDTKFAYIGGIAGWTTKGLSDLTNDGSVATSTTSTTWGSLTGAIRAHGGVVGYAEDEITLDKLVNNGAVSYSMFDNKINQSGSIVGGIIGYINGPVTLSNCTNNGYVFNCNFNNSSSPMTGTANTGAIAGAVLGTDAKSAVVSKCINNKELGCRRGILGGICGWAKKVNISECENYGGTEKGMLSGKVNENISMVQGGIVGNADTLAVITSCKAENFKLCYKPYTTACVTGGIAGKLLTSTSRIIECTSKDVIIEPQTNDKEDECLHGSLAGTSVGDSWIHSCKYRAYYGIKGDDPEELSSFELCSDINFDDDGNNEPVED